jgi:hypothetical protein
VTWLLLACAGEPPPEHDSAPTDPYVELSAPRLLRRMSLDLRGVLPSVEDLDRVEADPGALGELRDGYLEDPRFEERLVDLLAERWLTRVDEFLIGHREYPELASARENEFPHQQSVGEEPLRLMARVVVEDRPWTEVVTTDTTMANELLASIWPLEREAGEGWQPARYTDGRPAVGVLASNGLWWRYYTTVSNYNRGRVAAVSELLLCTDFLSRPVSVAEGPAITDTEALQDALRSDPYCLSCHAAIDPAAAALFGFWVANEYNRDEVDNYHPEREPQGELLLGVEPAWFGQPLAGLHELGPAIAADSRFATCAARSAAEMLWRRPADPTGADGAVLASLREVYLDSDQRLKPVLAAVTDTPAYRAGALDTADAEVLERELTHRLLAPQLLDSALADLTGFSWTLEGYEQLRNDEIGYRVLGGGVDGDYVGRAQVVPSLSQVVFQQRVAEAAAGHAVELDLAGEGPGLVVAGLQGQALRDRVAELHWHLLAVRPEVERLDGLVELYEGVLELQGEEQAWKTVLVVLLRDPEFVGR